MIFNMLNIIHNHNKCERLGCLLRKSTFELLILTCFELLLPGQICHKPSLVKKRRKPIIFLGVLFVFVFWYDPVI